VFVHAGSCFPRVLALLTEAGWDVTASAQRGPASGEIPDATCHVGIVCLPTADHELLAELEAAAPKWRHLELIAIVSPDVTLDPRAREFIATHCTDYQTTPIDAERLLFALGHAEGMAALAHRSLSMTSAASGIPELLGSSSAMVRLGHDIERMAAVDAPVMITGESGTGKELAARAIHRLSVRRREPFVAVNCVSLPPSLIHAELFGFEKGAFTGAHQRKAGHFELAQGGTIFLDEIGDLDPELQALLLRFLEEKTVRRVGGHAEINLDVRVLAATHIDLEAAVKAGRFRDDLYYRLNVLRLVMPPLRDRQGDIELLANAFFERYAGESHGRLRGFAPSALRAMQDYHWPGNVRELMNRVRRALVMSEGHLLTAEDLRLKVEPDEPPVINLDAARFEAERLSLLAALQHAGRSAGKAAALLGVSRATLYRLVERHGLKLDEAGLHSQQGSAVAPESAEASHS